MRTRDCFPGQEWAPTPGRAVPRRAELSARGPPRTAPCFPKDAPPASRPPRPPACPTGAYRRWAPSVSAQLFNSCRPLPLAWRSLLGKTLGASCRCLSSCSLSTPTSETRWPQVPRPSSLSSETTLSAAYAQGTEQVVLPWARRPYWGVEQHPGEERAHSQ